MRLRVRLTVFAILLVVTATAVCCLLLLSFAKGNAMQEVTETGLEAYTGFYTALLRQVSGQIPAQPAVRQSYLVHAFRSTDGFSAFTLRQGDRFLCNNVGFAIESLFEDSTQEVQVGVATVQYRTARVNGTAYFLAHAILPMGTDAYDVSYAQDISQTTAAMDALAAKCVITGAVVTVVAAVAMWLLVYRSLLPISRLKAGAAALAQGQYQNRIAIAGRDELSELASGFNSMADAIEANMGALREKSQRQQAFINDLSHELKTPVTSILLCAETLRDRKLPQEAATLTLNRIYDQGKWLEALSQKLMTLVLLQGELCLQPESVERLLEAVRATTTDALQAQGMHLVTECTMDALPMDFDLLRAALVNLVENARKASCHGQTVEIQAHDGVIAVTDHDRGIPPEEIARVTEPFYTVERSRSKKLGGAGLGLALVERIARAHGAAVSIVSTVGCGTSVRMAFPTGER